MNLLNHVPAFNNKFPAANPGQKQTRRNALNFVNNTGFPNRKNEQWKYIGLKNILETDFNFTDQIGSEVSHDALKKVSTLKLQGVNSFVFINGYLNLTLSHLEEEDKIEVNKLEVEHEFNNFSDAFEAMLFVYGKQYLQIKIKDNVKMEHPIHFMHYTTFGSTSLNSSVNSSRASEDDKSNSTSNSGYLFNQSMVQLMLGKNSKAFVLTSFDGAEDSSVLNNINFYIQLEDNANLEFVHTQNESLKSYNFSKYSFYLSQASNLNCFSLNKGAATSRTEVNVHLNKPDAFAGVYGTYNITGKQHSDHPTSIHHHVGSCSTNQLYKGILDGESKAVFNGKIYIDKHAQKAFSEQLNNNLLLSSSAEINTKPQLEIFADDVKAAHGSTVGQLSAEESFYLQSRGLSKDTSLKLLCEGFLADVTYKIENETVRNWAMTKI